MPMASQRSNIVIPNGNATTSGPSSTRSNNIGLLRSLSPAPPPPPMVSSVHALNAARTFNPRLILSQILCLQCFYYVVLGLIFQINHVLFATSITIDRIFTDTYLDVWSALGWIDNAAVIGASFFGSVLLVVIVEKSKKCLDFSVTLFVIHTVLCSLYSFKLPSTWDWWIVHFLGMILMVILGEYLCSKRELSDIPMLAM